MKLAASLGCLGAALLVAGCTRPDTSPAAPSGHAVEFVAAPPGDVATTVKQAVDRADREGRDLLVYVGATWCEPCQRFHRAAAAGLLDQAFPRLRLLEFDADRDNPRLAQAGYVSHMIPLFVLPGPDGRSSGLQIEGSIKGEGAVGEIAPRLANLIASRKVAR